MKIYQRLPIVNILHIDDCVKLDAVDRAVRKVGKGSTRNNDLASHEALHLTSVGGS